MSNEINSVRPLDNRVLVKKEDAKDRTRGGIVLPHLAQKDTRQGVVIEAGPGKLLKNGMRAEPQVRRGDRVIYSQYSGTDIKIKGVAHMMLEEDGIICVVEEGVQVD